LAGAGQDEETTEEALNDQLVNTNNAAERIAAYLGEARQNRETLFAVIDRLLQ
jgi:hypothetical protein